MFWASAENTADLRYLPKHFLTASLRAFAERFARRHGCTNLRLPT